MSADTRKPIKFRAPERRPSPLVEDNPLLVADAKLALQHVSKAEAGRQRVALPDDGAVGGSAEAAGEATQGARSVRPTDPTPARVKRTAASAAPRVSEKRQMVRVFVVPRLTATAAARYNSLPVPEQDRALWTGQVLRKTFGTWAEAALANLPTRERAATRLREPRRAFVSLGRVSVMCPETTLAALRSAAGDTLEVYPDAAILGVWASLCLEEELARRVGI